MATVLISNSVAARKMRMAISPLLAAMSFLIWRLGANASVLLAVVRVRRKRVERIILPLSESTAPHLFHSARHLGRLVNSFFQPARCGRYRRQLTLLLSCNGCAPKRCEACFRALWLWLPLILLPQRAGTKTPLETSSLSVL